MCYDSPCENCVHRFQEEIETGLYMDECDEYAPDGVFGGEWGCYCYEERKYDDY